MRAKKLLTSRKIFRYAVPARTVTKKHWCYSWSLTFLLLNKVLLVDLLAALNFANVFKKQKKVWIINLKKNDTKRKKRDQNKKNVKNVFFYIYESF